MPSVHPTLRGMSGNTLQPVTRPSENLLYSGHTDVDVTSTARRPSFFRSKILNMFGLGLRLSPAIGRKQRYIHQRDESAAVKRISSRGDLLESAPKR